MSRRGTPALLLAICFSAALLLGVVGCHKEETAEPGYYNGAFARPGGGAGQKAAPAAAQARGHSLKD